MENDSMMNEMDAENNEVWTVEGMATCDYLDDVIQKRWRGNACVQDYIESFSDIWKSATLSQAVNQSMMIYPKSIKFYGCSTTAALLKKPRRS